MHYNFQINLNILPYIQIYLDNGNVQTNKISIRLTPNIHKLIKKIEFYFKNALFFFF